MIKWTITSEGFRQDKITSNGNKFFVGNGYLGIRGTLPEYEKEEYPAINLSGLYDQVGDAWREPLNAPNGLFTYLEFEGEEYRLPKVLPLEHRMSLNYRHGIFTGETRWKTPKGSIRVSIERFASLYEKHLIVMKYSVYSEVDGELTINTGIDGEVWDINGPHYDEMQLSENNSLGLAIGCTHEKKDHICVCEACHSEFPAKEHWTIEDGKLLRRLGFHCEAGKSYHIYKYVSIYTSKDEVEYMRKASETAEAAKMIGYEAAIGKHKAEWEKLWNISEVSITGDDAAMEALNYSIYHLHSIAPRHTDCLSIPARGLSGQTYKGAIFWDTEMFMLDLFLFTEPSVAKTLIKYRIDTLAGAKEKARHYGYQGAFYAWESQEGGYDACSDYNVIDVFTGRPMRTYFKDKQIHISAAVVYGIMRYLSFTGNYDLLEEGGAEVILECARFYYDLLVKKVHLDRYELHDMIGPDEYHERVNNNAYTNRMAKFTFESAIKVIERIQNSGSNLKETLEMRYVISELLKCLKDAANKLYIPEPDPENGIIEQFDGYMQLEDVSLVKLKERILNEKEYLGGANGIAAHTKIIKQADVVTLLNLFSQEYNNEILLKNWEYYEPRTEHGSSLSACMYAMLACKCSLPEIAYPLFMKSASADLKGEGKEWAGLIYIGGTHPASAGGAYMTAIEGFAGLHLEEGKLALCPKLPSHWEKLKFKVMYLGELYQATITKAIASIEKLENPMKY